MDIQRGKRVVPWGRAALGARAVDTSEKGPSHAGRRTGGARAEGMAWTHVREKNTEIERDTEIEIDSDWIYRYTTREKHRAGYKNKM